MIGMATDAFPATFSGITRWAKDRGMAAGEARRRYAQFVVLVAVANSPVLGEMVVYKAAMPWTSSSSPTGARSILISPSIAQTPHRTSWPRRSSAGLAPAAG